MKETALDIVREFVADIEAVYTPTDNRSLADDWPDLHITYEKAKTLIAKQTN